MSDCERLLPPPHVIHERLTRNQRERHLLRALLRLTIDAERIDREPRRQNRLQTREGVRA
jgi:hypothetical protein